MNVNEIGPLNINEVYLISMKIGSLIIKNKISNKPRASESHVLGVEVRLLLLNNSVARALNAM